MLKLRVKLLWKALVLLWKALVLGAEAETVVSPTPPLKWEGEKPPICQE